MMYALRIGYGKTSGNPAPQRIAYQRYPRKTQSIEKAFQGHPFAEKRLRELIGHTPVQVIVGGLLGILIGLLVTF